MASNPNAEADAVGSEKRPGGFISDIILNAVEPGVNYSVLIFLNIVFVLLFSTLVLFTVITDFNIHLIFLSILTLGLMVGINIFISQLQSSEDEQATSSNTNRTTIDEKRSKED